MCSWRKWAAGKSLENKRRTHLSWHLYKSDFTSVTVQWLMLEGIYLKRMFFSVCIQNHSRNPQNTLSENEFSAVWRPESSTSWKRQSLRFYKCEYKCTKKKNKQKSFYTNIHLTKWHHWKCTNSWGSLSLIQKRAIKPCAEALRAISGGISSEKKKANFKTVFTQ